jgi:hypothetical protein
MRFKKHCTWIGLLQLSFAQHNNGVCLYLHLYYFVNWHFNSSEAALLLIVTPGGKGWMGYNCCFGAWLVVLTLRIWAARSAKTSKSLVLGVVLTDSSSLLLWALTGVLIRLDREACWRFLAKKPARWGKGCHCPNSGLRHQLWDAKQRSREHDFFLQLWQRWWRVNSK